MRRLLLLVCAMALGPSLAFAQSPTGPTIEMRLRSVQDLASHFEYLGGIVNQAEPAKQAAAFFQSLSDETRGIEGIDPGRPIGLYATITADVIDSPVVLMVPLANEEAFLGLLTGKLSLDPRKDDSGAYRLDVPNVPAPVFFRFANRHVYVTVQTAAGLDPKKLLDPKPFFAAPEDAILSAKLFLDRLPASVKKTILAQYELKVNDGKDEAPANESAAQKKLRIWALDQSTALMKQLFDDAEEFSLRVSIQPKTDDLTLDAKLKAKTGSALEKAFRSVEGRAGPAASLAAPSGAMLSAATKLTLTDNSKTSLEPIIDALVQDAIAQAKESERGVVKLVFDALLPTLKSGELETSLYATNPNANGKIGGLLALKVVEGKKIEQTVKQFAPFIPESSAKFTFDVKTVDGIVLHKVTIPNLKEVFASDTLWLGTSDRYVLASVEDEGTAIATAAAKLPTTGKTAPVARLLVSASGMVRVTEKQLKPDEILMAIQDAGAHAKADTLGFDVRGLTVEGNQASLKVHLKGTAVKVFVMIDAAKKK